MKDHISEIILVLLLVGLVACVRVYYGGPDGLMIVWKGECNFQDTVVNLPEVLEMPRKQLAQNHRSVLWQLEEMGLLQPELPRPQRQRGDDAAEG